ncbi:DEAD/DEAH box helicase family protein [Streptomyces tendae]|uniref:hypothetical protein n=1 Tax=Streptomyces tendae TaxID=1932 RepID=UPI0036695581
MAIRPNSSSWPCGKPTNRLSTALRYARALQRGGTGRFTSRSGHDTCFQALADVVALAEEHPQIGAITVIRRDR